MNERLSQQHLDHNRLLAALASAGLLATAVGAELQNSRPAMAAGRTSAAAEIAANKDPFSQHIDQGLTMILTGLKSLAHRKVHGIYHYSGKDSSGRSIDEYVYSQPSFNHPNLYDQVVCRVAAGQTIPDVCGIFFGAPAPNSLSRSFNSAQLLDRVQNRPNSYISYMLEQINPSKRGVDTTTYLKNGSHYTIQSDTVDGVQHTHPVTVDRISQNYDDFISSAVDMMQSASLPAA